jgi:hypothetical protein
MLPLALLNGLVRSEALSVALGEITFDEGLAMFAEAGVPEGLGAPLLRIASMEAGLVSLVEKEITVKGLSRILARVRISEAQPNIGECDQLFSLCRDHLTTALEAGVCDIDEAIDVFTSFGTDAAIALDSLCAPVA